MKETQNSSAPVSDVPSEKQLMNADERACIRSNDCMKADSMQGKHPFAESDRTYMQMALAEAKAALETGDVPVGAVLVNPSAGIIARGRNTREALHTALGHAELNAISDACAALGSWRLSECTLYVTLEPCPMCAGAILHARIGRVVYGAADPVAGAMGSVWALHRHPIRNTHTSVEYGCCESECRDLLQTFFKGRRSN